MKTHYHALLLLTIILLFPLRPLSLIQAQTQIGELEKEKVDEIFTAWDSKETPGAAVAIVKDGAIIYKNAYGMANLEYDIPISPSSIFHIASVSKQFTVFSVLLLQSEGKLSLDEDIRKYIIASASNETVIIDAQQELHPNLLEDLDEIIGVFHFGSVYQIN